MSGFDFGSLKKSKKKTEEVKEQPSQQTSYTRTPRMPQIDEKSLANMVTKDDIQSLKNDVLKALKQTIPQTFELEEIGLIHKFNRENLIEFIGRRGKRGTKLCELRDFFYPTPAGEIDKEVQKIRKEGIIQKNRNGWMSLMIKGKKSLS